MKRETLKALNLTDEQIDAVMAENGKDITKHQTDLTAVQLSLETLTTQLKEANTTIEGFKGMKPEDVDKTIGEWKTKAEQAQVDGQKQVSVLKRSHALEKELKETYKIKDVELKSAKAHLDDEKLLFDEKTETFTGLKEQVEPWKPVHAGWFADAVQPPQIVSGGNNQSVISDKVVAEARKGAGLPV
jgi:predicted  nucleic acid-binding Zn-ribbon protein